MTSSEIRRFGFSSDGVTEWSVSDRRHSNWPVVYVLGDDAPRSASSRLRNSFRRVYVGETLDAATRMRQHLKSQEKVELDSARVIVDERFNKSVCLDLEAFLIAALSGDGTFQVLNRNVGIRDRDYYDRHRYREQFQEIFEQLRLDGVFSRSLPSIQNSDLFKLSPFKALTEDQAAAVEDILEGLFADLESDASSEIVVAGQPGTGKTIVAIFLLKLLADIAATRGDDVDEGEAREVDSPFAEYFTSGHPDLLRGRRIGLVVPQQSLRKSIQRVFRRTPGLDPAMVLSPFDVAEAVGDFDLLIVDEAHRLSQRANQASGVQNAKFARLTEALFGYDDVTKTQLDWIRARSRHQLYLLDSAQSVRPADLPKAAVGALVGRSQASGRHYRLATQMRVRAGADYVGHVRRLLGAESGGAPSEPLDLGEYDLRIFDDLAEMRREVLRLDDEHGLARLVAGYAWPWRSKTDPSAADIEIDGVTLQWNRTATDWIASPTSRDEVGSIHTVQGYDLNYAGVIIGEDLRYDPIEKRLVFHRESYFDTKGKENNPRLGITYSDTDLLTYIANIYAVLMTRGIRGTFVYVCDRPLREYLRGFVPYG